MARRRGGEIARSKDKGERKKNGMTNAKYQMTNQCQMPNILAVSNQQSGFSQRKNSGVRRIKEKGKRPNVKGKEGGRLADYWLLATIFCRSLDRPEIKFCNPVKEGFVAHPQDLGSSAAVPPGLLQHP